MQYTISLVVFGICCARCIVDEVNNHPVQYASYYGGSKRMGLLLIIAFTYLTVPHLAAMCNGVNPSVFFVSKQSIFTFTRTLYILNKWMCVTVVYINLLECSIFTFSIS